MNMKIVVWLNVIGLIVSLYLLALDFGQAVSSSSSFCEISSVISCSAVRNSPYAKFLNVPLAAFGVIWFALMLAVSLKLCGRHGHSRAAHERYVADDMLFTAQIVWLAAGLASVFYFLYAEFVIGAICPLCTVVHIDIAAQAFFLWRCHQRRGHLNPRARLVTNMLELVQGALTWVLLAAALCVAALLLFNVAVDLSPPVWTLSAEQAVAAGAASAVAAGA